MAGIYIHIPFCKKKCSYCDFHFSTSLSKKDDIILCLIKELEIRKKYLNENIETITTYINKILEEMVKKNPAQWIWTHDRWK